MFLGLQLTDPSAAFCSRSVDGVGAGFGGSAFPHCQVKPLWTDVPNAHLTSLEPVLVAQGFEWSSCMATLMGAHALGSSLDDWREGNSSCYKPVYPSRGQWLPYRGHDMEKTSFPPHSAHLSRGCGFKPCDRQNNLAHKSRVEVAACSRLHESSGHGFESGFHRKYGLARPIVLARSYILILEISTS